MHTHTRHNTVAVIVMLALTVATLGVTSSVFAWNSDIPAATTTTAGVVTKASDAQAAALSSDDVVVTPGNLGSFSASTTQKGMTLLSNTGTMDVGTSTVRVPSVYAVTSSKFGKKTVVIKVVEDGTAVTAGNGKACFTWPFAGTWYLEDAGAHTYSPTTGNTCDVQLRNQTNGDVDMLSTLLTIDSGESDSVTATANLVVNDTNDAISEGDEVCIDVDQIQSATMEGLEVRVLGSIHDSPGS